MKVRIKPSLLSGLTALCTLSAGAADEPQTKLADDAVFLAPLPPLPADAPAPSADPHNLAGVYYSAAGTSNVPDGPGAAERAHAPVYTPAAVQYLQYERDMEVKGTPLGGLKATCRPYVGVRGTYIPGMIAQSSDEVVIIGELGRSIWQVHLNRDHPKQLQPSYMGDSVGRWEGDTLVVDTIGFNGKEALISTQQHVVTRIRKVDGGKQLEMKFTVTDPVNYVEPHEITTVLAWRPDYTVLEDQCEENLEIARHGLHVD